MKRKIRPTIQYSNCISKVRLLIAVFALLLSTKGNSQVTATWALTADKTSAVTGSPVGAVTSGAMVPGANFTANGGHNNDGFKNQPASAWITTATDGWHLDFPVSPTAMYDFTITGLTFAARTSGSSGNNVASLAYQVNGAGPWISFGTPQTIASGGSSNIDFGTLNTTFTNGNTYVLRMYLYAAGSGTSASRSVYVKNFALVGNAVPGGPAPTVVTTSVNSVLQTTATANGSITSGGSWPVTASGFCVGTAANPTTANLVFSTSPLVTTGAYNIGLTGLAASTLYHIRAYATSAVGTSYGADLTFTTLAPVIPTLTTAPASNISPVTALSGGNITDNGGAAVTARGVCWNTSPNPTIANSTTPSGTGNGSYTSLLSVLLPSTTYYARAYATNSVGTAYGNEITFTTPPAAPTIIVNPSVLSFGTIQQGSTSAEQTYTLTAYFLTPATGSLTITAPAGYRISLTSGTGFVSSLSLPYTGGTIPTTTIYVRFSPTGIANYSGKNITNAGGGATTQNVTVNGEVEPVASQGQQGFSNKGKDFWVGYGATEKMYGDNSQDLRFTFNNPNSTAATVTISIPNQAGFTPLVYNVPANSVITTAANEIPEGATAGIDARLRDEGVSNRGIHIESTLPIVAYAHNVTSQVYAASLLFPTPVLGREYTSLNFTQRSNFSNARSYCFAIATEDNTILEVTLPPNVSTETHPGSASPTVFTQTLNKGEVLNLFGIYTGQPNLHTGNDLTGVKVKSISSGSTSCKPFAFFSGSSKITIDCDNGSNGSADNLFQQMFPKVAWGLKYITVPTLGLPRNHYRILVDDPATVVKVNGVAQAGLVNNTYYQYFNDDQSIDVIEADKPIMVAQFMTTHGECSNSGSNGDPEMIFLSSIQQTIDTVSLVSSPLGTSSGRQHFINVTTKTSAVPGFKLDGAAQVSSFTAVPFDPTYSYAQFTVPEASHTLTSTVGFNATAYGIASDESYGYNAGTNVMDLFSGFNIQNQFGAGSAPNACRGSEFYMRITLAFKATSITWDFGNNVNLAPNASVTQVSPIPEDSVTINGTKLYIYKLPASYIFGIVGSFNVNITALNPTPDGCNGVRQFTFPVNVVQGPTANFTFTNNGCLVPVPFTNTSVGNGYTIDQFQWDFVDPTTAPNNVSTIATPTHSFSAGGTYAVKFRVITTEGCYADVTKNVALSAVPVAAFTQSASTCETVAVNFNSTTSTIAPVGSITQWAWNFGDPASGANNTSIAQNPSHTFATANNYTVSLTVTSSTGCPSIPVTKTVTVNPKPVADFAAPTNACSNSVATFNGLPNGMASYAWNFGETGSPTNTATTQNATHQYATAGTFNPSLTVTSAQGCVGTVTKPVVLAAPLSSPVVTVTTIGATSLTFTWAAVAGASSYQVSVDGINFITPSSGATGLTHTVTGLTANQSVTLTVRAVAAIACQNSTGNATGLTLYPDVGLFVPNTFTPNGDGKNDILKVYGNYLQKMNIKIFNQWGEKVFESNDPNSGWGGNCRGQQQPVGVYVYVVTATMPDGRIINKKGTINLIR